MFSNDTVQGGSREKVQSENTAGGLVMEYVVASSVIFFMEAPL